jgi:cyclic pyranopterin phosphate synthase
MPREVFGQGFRFLPQADILTFEEIARLTGVFVGLGVRKVRLTGGEPLLRRDVERLVAMLSGVEGLEDLTMTTNGSLLARKAEALAAAGLGRISVSLDSLDDEVFGRLNDVAFPVRTVVQGMEAAERAGLRPIKVNMVVRRGLNEDSVLPMARFARERGYILRFIEYMDVGHSNGWRLDEVVPSAEIVAAIDAEMPLTALPPRYPGEVADRWSYRDDGGEVGVISSVSEPFCGACTRARITAEGQLFTCLFGVRGTDLRGALRSGADDEALQALIGGVWARRTDRYSELRSEATTRLAKVEMSHIGG